ncbi:MAG TPA: AMP-binding protein [Acidimicrobiales bacterium]|jgi:enterobactin synthetase component F|nr:AMP-binding protein [Acidimicrobiales bacterium]
MTAEPTLSGIADFARHDPNRIALELPDQKLTFGELDIAADRLAQRLLADCGLLSETEANDPTRVVDREAHPRIPLLLEGTAAIMVAAEAIQRAGMVYVPLDPTSSEFRVKRILQEVGAPVLLTDLRQGEIEGIPCRHPLHDGLPTSAEPIRRAPGPVHSIVFTSGSTGNPKGILKPPNQYGTISEFLRLGFGMSGELRVGILAAGSVSATVPVLQLLLQNGFTTVALEMKRQEIPIGEWLRHAHLQAFAAVPTLLRHALASLESGVVIDGLKFVGVFGETTTWEDVSRLRSHVPTETSIFNIYGQGEAGSIAVMPVTADTPIGQGLLPVGHPLPGRTITIVDEDGRPVPPGGRGEIVVEGPSVSLGYWGVPDDGPSAVFTTNGQGVTVVRTGDAGRLRPDGVLEHLGRLDHVVKIAGNRVDLVEIETALMHLPHVVDAAATTYIDGAGELRLRAFVVVRGFTIANSQTLRGQLRQALARPLLPDAIETLDELPRLPNGKVDRKRLPTTPPRLTWSAGASSRPPADEMEQMVAALWSSVLGVDDIGIDDNFFDLGGDSLRAVRLAEAIERSLGVDMPAWMLIEHPTIGNLVGTLGLGSPTETVVTIQAASEGTPIFVAYDNFGSLFSARNYLTAIGLEQPIYGLRARAWEKGPVPASLQAVAAQHVDDILTVRSEGAVVLYGQATGSLLAFEIARQLLERGTDVPLLVVGTSAGPPLQLVPGASRIKHQFRTWNALPRRAVPGAVAEVALAKGRQFARQATNRTGKSRAKLHGTRGHETNNGPANRSGVTRAVELYGDLALRYRPPSHYPGRVLLIKPSWLDQPIEDRWRHWVDGPLRISDVEELRVDLATHSPPRLEWLAPP